ncbi:DUF4397 domain-containing protein [Peribacillus frigoritolerans]|uniref:DUF4397 domain-containing protein n=1 Tax=Peribacillus frigoritolerans TaxID=450367 RepID=UPI0010596E4C|nr:DUF4397 domain-containing protein [Peribacillus frigoritolerans]TDL82705.1 DUF4397 domain-containing protein [Peribacillus frigoritolerans]
MKKIFSMMAAMVLLLALGTGVYAAENDAMVRIVHASPDAPAVDVVVDGKTVVEGAEFKAATDYMMVPAGDHKVEIFAAGTVADGEPVISADLTVEAGMAYTAAAINKLDSLELKVLNDDNMVTEGKAKVRVSHLSPDAPAVDVAVKGGDVLFPGAEFKGVTDYIEVDPGSYDLEVRGAGTEDVVLDLAGTELKANMAYTVIAVGFAGGEPALEALVLADSAMMPSEMPKTGMGGTSAADTTNYLPIAAVSILGLGALMVYGYKKKASSH